jgi:hypothetical protein
MKIAILNFSGNVGKSTVARHLFSPQLNNAKIFPIETINSDGSEGDAARGRDIIKVQIEMQLIDDAIVDIGSSNVEDVISVWGQNPGMHEDFDFFIIPIVPAMKQQRDTISTIESLADLGVPAKRIRVLFNQVDLKDDVESVFAGIFEYQKEEKKFTLRPDAILHMNPLYPRLASSSASIAQILADKTNYKEKIIATENKEEKLLFLQLLSLQRAAAGLVTELDNAFKAVLK